MDDQRDELEQPDLSTIGGRLQWARLNKRLSSARRAAAAFGWNENTYKAHEQGLRGSEGLKVATAEKYARAFGVNPQWLLTGKGAAIAASETQREWEGLSEEDRRLAISLVRVAGRSRPLIESMPEAEVEQDELPAHFKGARSKAKPKAPDAKDRQDRRR